MVSILLADGSVSEEDVGRPEGPKPQDREHELLIAIERTLLPKIVVEVGALYGGTTVCLAWHLPPGGRVYALDLLYPEGSVPRLEAWGVRDRVVLVPGDSRQTIPTLPDGIGLAFIDGNHAYEYAKSDAEGLWGKMLPGGIMVFHDVWPQTDASDVLSAPPLDREVQFITDVRRYVFDAFPHAIHIPHGQGLALVQKPIREVA